MALNCSLGSNASFGIAKLSFSDEISLYQKEIKTNIKLEENGKLSKVTEFESNDEEDTFVKEEQMGNYDSYSSSLDLSEINFAEKLLQFSQYEQLGSELKQKRKSSIRKRRTSTAADHPYKCPECISSFTSKGNLRFHIKTVHERVVSYPCPKCEAVFSQKGNYKTHFNSVHLQIRPFECLICEAVFSQKGNLKTHLNKMHYSEAAITDPSVLMKSPLNKKRGRPPTFSLKSLNEI